MQTDNKMISTGIEGLDDILNGGLTPNSLYLIEGDPGSGKTTLGLQFLLEGARQGEKGLYVTLSETKQELTKVGESHGWSLDPLSIYELIPSEESLKSESQYKMFHPSEVELNETTRRILDEVERLRPTRIVFDSLSEMRLLAQNPLRYRRQILALKQFFVGRACTVLLLDDRTSEQADLQPQSVAHGVISLSNLTMEYGTERRRLRVTKMRGVQFRGGFHDFVIRRGGLDVFPRLVAAEHHETFEFTTLSSGVRQLDDLLGGGLQKGTSTLVLGPAGSGKSSLATQYILASAERGEAALILAFDESRDMLLHRARSIGQSLDKHVAEGRVIVRQVDPAEMSPGELAQTVRRAVEKNGVKVVMIDSLNGYANSMPEERFLTIQLHELLTYLSQKGITTLLVTAQTGIMGTSMRAPGDTSYLADSVVMLRYFEAHGAINKAISVVKKRGGQHESTIRQFQITGQGLRVGDPLLNFRGVLTGVPVQETVAMKDDA